MEELGFFCVFSIKANVILHLLFTNGFFDLMLAGCRSFSLTKMPTFLQFLIDDPSLWLKMQVWLKVGFST